MGASAAEDLVVALGAPIARFCSLWALPDQGVRPRSCSARQFRHQGARSWDLRQGDVPGPQRGQVSGEPGMAGGGRQCGEPAGGCDDRRRI